MSRVLGVLPRFCVLAPSQVAPMASGSLALHTDLRDEPQGSGEQCPSHRRYIQKWVRSGEHQGHSQT
jgi:hypothetical protein